MTMPPVAVELRLRLRRCPCQPMPMPIWWVNLYRDLITMMMVWFGDALRIQDNRVERSTIWTFRAQCWFSFEVASPGCHIDIAATSMHCPLFPQNRRSNVSHCHHATTSTTVVGSMSPTIQVKAAAAAAVTYSMHHTSQYTTMMSTKLTCHQVIVFPCGSTDKYARRFKPKWVD